MDWEGKSSRMGGDSRKAFFYEKQYLLLPVIDWEGKGSPMGVDSWRDFLYENMDWERKGSRMGVDSRREFIYIKTVLSFFH